MEPVYGNREPEKALRVDSASFRALSIRDASTTGLHTDAAAKAADPNAWTFTPEKNGPR